MCCVLFGLCMVLIIDGYQKDTGAKLSAQIIETNFSRFSVRNFGIAKRNS